MSIESVRRFRRIAHIAHSRHPVARLYRCWRYFGGPAEQREPDGGPVNALLLPLTLLVLTALLVATVPGASDAVASACGIACMP